MLGLEFNKWSGGRVGSKMESWVGLHYSHAATHLKSGFNTAIPWSLLRSAYCPANRICNTSLTSKVVSCKTRQGGGGWCSSLEEDL